eukprot:COSAG02_NODE_227_length_28153_cov_11.662294_15_plen_130_part_00
MAGGLIAVRGELDMAAIPGQDVRGDNTLVPEPSLAARGSVAVANRLSAQGSGPGGLRGQGLAGGHEQHARRIGPPELQLPARCGARCKREERPLTRGRGSEALRADSKGEVGAARGHRPQLGQRARGAE